MTRRSLALGLLIGLAPAAGYASDIAEALQFAEPIMGEEIADGYEDFVDYDTDEALSLLLSRDVVPGMAPERYLDQDGNGIGLRPSNTFETLGETRLNYAALEPHIKDASVETGLPAGLIDAVIRTESGYRPNAISRAGAQGLMQLMPATARSVGVKNAFDPRENILGGAKYLRKMYDQFGSVRLAIAAYNAGPAAVQKHNGVPPYQETRRYVETVIRRFDAVRYR